MASTIKVATIETQLTTTITSIAQAGANEKLFIGQATFTNTSTGNVEVTLWRLNEATTATEGSGGNWLVKKTIAPGKTWISLEVEGHALGNSQSIKAKADTADVVNADISGAKES